MSSVDQRYYFGPTKFVKKRLLLQKKSPAEPWDFTVREEFHPHRLFVATVRWNSDSYAKGLRPNDQILSINQLEITPNFSFGSLDQLLHHSHRVELHVLTLRVHQLDSVVYDWYNPIEERSTSPPPSTYLSSHAFLNYPERTVKMNVDKGRKLGLVIRGGREYGLGIFISGIDRGSTSEQKGLSVGDQILAVNGHDFRHISHENAVDILRQSSLLNIHLRQMNKLPLPKYAAEQPTIKRGRSSSEWSGKSTRWNEFEEKLCSLVSNPAEETLLRHSLDDYLKKRISLDHLLQEISQLIEQFPPPNKKRFLSNLREILHSSDRDHFEIFLLKADLNRLKKSHEELLHQCEMSSSTKWKSRSLGHLNGEENERIRRPSSLELSKEDELPVEHHFSSSSQRSETNLNADDRQIIDEFLQDYSPPYRLTIHKVRPTLGIAIEGGKSDRVPLPRLVYIQPDGSAYVSSGLRVGDVLLNLNGQSFEGLSHRQCALIIASAFKDPQRSTMNFLVVQPKSH